jgi:Fur family ferric uptake transcriptional regulator
VFAALRRLQAGKLLIIQRFPAAPFSFPVKPSFRDIPRWRLDYYDEVLPQVRGNGGFVARAPAATRRTAQKEAVWRALKTAPGFVSANQLHQRLVSQGESVGLATVYRQLAALTEEGLADTIADADGQLYRICEPNTHHHHLVCDRCGRAVEIEPPTEDWFVKVASDHGYTLSRHVLEVFGLCPDCASTSPAERL